MQSRIVPVSRLAPQHAPRTESLAKPRVLGIVDVFRLLLRVEVIQISEELIKTMHRGQELVAVAQVVLAELARHVAVLLEQDGDGRVFLLHPFRRAGKSDLGQAGPHGGLSGDERRAAGGTALLAVPVGEHGAFGCDPVDVRSLVAHHPHVVGGDVELTDVVAPDD